MKNLSNFAPGLKFGEKNVITGDSSLKLDTLYNIK